MIAEVVKAWIIREKGVPRHLGPFFRLEIADDPLALRTR